MEPTWIAVGISGVSLLIVLVNRQNTGVIASILSSKDFKESVATIAKSVAMNPCEDGRCGILVSPIFSQRVAEISNTVCSERMNEFGADFVRSEVHREITENFRAKIAELTEAVKALDGTVKLIPNQLIEAIGRLEDVVTQKASPSRKRRVR